MSVLELQNISKSFDGKAVLNDCSLEVFANEILALIGESGSGKSTLLRIIAGFEIANEGVMRIGEQILFGDNHFVKAEKRKVAIVFQDYALFPHLTVDQNIRFGMPKTAKNDKELNQLLEIFELTNFRKNKPNQLSGGQQQRVAIARAIASKPDVLLLDEPFSNLDQSLRKKVRKEILKIKVDFQLPIIMVTHDPEDTIALADRVAVLENGKIIQTDSPLKLYHEPINTYVAQLFGPAFVWKNKIYRPEQVKITPHGQRDKVVEINPNIHYHLVLLQSQVILMDYAKKLKVGDDITWSIE
ncbi:MAG: ABC transporter ATP-binding protein [Crocinitomicaceae bacterium]|nr:ABC transporter ATP-binding protein [Crocinitomicaceae bacterium]